MGFNEVKILMKSVAASCSVSNYWTVARDQAMNIKDGVRTPIIGLISFTRTSDINESTNRFTKTYNCQIIFAQADELSKSEDAKNNIVAAMEILQDEFLFRLSDSDPVSLISGILSTPFYNRYDQNLSGIQCNFNIELYENADYCQFE